MEGLVFGEDKPQFLFLSGTRRLSLMSGGVPVTQLDEVSPREAPMEVSQFNLEQESDTVSGSVR